MCVKCFCADLSAAHALHRLCQAIWEASNWHFSELLISYNHFWSSIRKSCIFLASQ